MTKTERKQIVSALKDFLHREYGEIYDGKSNEVGVAYTCFGKNENVKMQVTLYIDKMMLVTTINGIVTDCLKYGNVEDMIWGIDAYSFEELVDFDETLTEVFEKGYFSIGRDLYPISVVAEKLRNYYEVDCHRTSWSILPSLVSLNEEEKRILSFSPRSSTTLVSVYVKNLNGDMVCANCGSPATYQIAHDGEVDIWAFDNYCPHCGAKICNAREMERR